MKKIICSRFVLLVIIIWGTTHFGFGEDKESIEFRPFNFVSNAGETGAAETGWLTVPELHNAQQSKSIRLPVIRLKSTAERPDYPIVYLAGGPGDSGLATAKDEIFPLLMALRQRADVIIFDQRGTGQSEPNLTIPGKLSIPPEALLEEEATRLNLIEQSKAAVAELTKHGINLAAYNTAENADDLEDLRKALGVEKINIWGHSYGSHLGLAFIKRHPDSVSKAILGGVNGLDQRWRYPSNLDDLIRQVDFYIDQNPKLKKQMPSLRQSITKVFSDLEKNPVVFTSQGKTLKFGKLELQTIVAVRSGDLTFIKMLPLLFGQMQTGEYELMAQTVAGLKERDWGTAMRYSMHIASGGPVERLKAIEDQEKTALFGRGLNYPFNEKDFVNVWNVPDLGEDFRQPVKSNIPVLFMSGNLDGRASLADTNIIRQGFPNSQHLLIEGGSHNFYALSPAILPAMLDFLSGKKVVERISVPVELRGAGERKIILALRKIFLEKGAEPALKTLRDWNAPKSDYYISSYVIGTLGIILMREDKKIKEALELYKLGIQLFPDNLFVNERLAEAFELNDMKSEALAQYQKCLTLNSLNRRPAVKIAELSK